MSATITRLLLFSFAGMLALCSILVTGMRTSALQATASTNPSIEDLEWMAGSWQSAPGRVQSEEHWTKPAGGTMFAVSRTLAGGKTVFFEYLRIEARPEGIFYVAMPRGQKATDFKLTSLEGQSAVFENPQHDHPQKISYRKNSDGSLTARIEGDAAGKKQPQTFHFLPMK